jgi:hypothetical protein
MRKLVIILLAFIAVVTFIRAIDNSETVPQVFSSEIYERAEVSNF